MEKLSPHCVAWTLLLRCSWVKNNSKKLNPFHSCAGKTSKGRAQVKQGLIFFLALGILGVKRCGPWLTGRGWQKPQAQAHLYQPNLWILVVRWGGAQTHSTGEISVLAIPSAALSEMLLQCGCLSQALVRQRWLCSGGCRTEFLVH